MSLKGLKSWMPAFFPGFLLKITKFQISSPCTEVFQGFLGWVGTLKCVDARRHFLRDEVKLIWVAATKGDSTTWSVPTNPFKDIWWKILENISLSLHTIRDEDHDSLLQWTDDIFPALSRILSQDVKRWTDEWF